MFNNLTYKKKLKALGVIGVLILLISYKLAFSKTIDQYSIYKRQAAIGSAFNDEIPSVENLLFKEKKINTFLNQFILDTVQNEKNFLFVCGEFCESNNIKIKEYIPGKIQANTSLKTITNSIAVEGSFIKILKFINYLETQKKIGYLISANFKSITDYGSKSTKLNCIIYIQNFLFNDYAN